MELVRRTLKRISRSLPPDYCSNEFSIRAERGAFPPSPSSLNAPHEETSPEEEAQQSPLRRSRAPSREIPELEIPTNSSRAINGLPTPEASEAEEGILQHSDVEQTIKREEEEESLHSNGSEERGDEDNYTIAGTSDASEMSDDASDATCNSTPPRQPGRVYTRVPMQRNGTQRSMAEMNRYNNMDIYGQRTIQAQERQILAAERALRLAQREADIARRTLAERRVDVVAATQRLEQLRDEMHTLRARAPQHWALREVIPRHVAARAQPAPGSLRPRLRPQPQAQNNRENNAVGEERSAPVAGPSQPPLPRVQPPLPSIKSSTSRAPSPARSSTGSNKRTREEDGEPAADDAESDHSGSAGRRTRIRLEDAADPVRRPSRRRAAQPNLPVRRSARLRDVASRNRALEAEASVAAVQPVEASQPAASSSRVTDGIADGGSSDARGRKRSRDEAEDTEDGESDERKGKGKDSKRRRR